MTPSSSDQNNGGLIADTRWAFNMLLPVMRGLACTTKVFLRTNMGSQQPGFAGLFGLGAILLTAAGAAQAADGPAVGLYAGLFLLACLAHRLSGVTRHLMLRPQVHSHYDGYPIICRLWPRCLGGPVDEMLVKRFVEPLLIASFGYWVAGHGSRALGTLWFWSGVSLAVTTHITHMLEEAELRGMRDALMVQRERAQRLRQLLDASGEN